MPVDYATLQRLIRPLPADEHARLTCPDCAYDVRQTLIDGFDRCPECGTRISVRTCKPPAWEDSRLAVAYMFGVFFLPTPMVLATPIVWRAWSTVAPLWVVALGVLAVAYLLVVAGYRHARRRMGENPSVARSFGDGALVVFVNLVLVAFVVVMFVI